MAPPVTTTSPVPFDAAGAASPSGVRAPDLLRNLTVRALTPADLPAVAALHAARFGPGRFARTAYRVREGGSNLSPYCLGAWAHDTFLGSITMTAITIGASQGHWLLGPLAVSLAVDGQGVGRRLVTEALNLIATRAPTGATVILVGDQAYYSRLGFQSVPHGVITLPGPVAAERILIWRGPQGDQPLPTGPIRRS